MKSVLFLRLSGVVALCASIVGGAPRVQAQTANVFADEFNSGQLDNASWFTYDKRFHIQRTQFGLNPQFGADSDGTKFVRIPLQSYNPYPLYTGKEFYGCQLVSRTRWDMGTGIEYEARLRSNRLPPGLVLGFFSYGDAGTWNTTYQKTEIDYEFLTSQRSDSIWLNIWDNWNPDRRGPSQSSLTPVPGLNWNNNSWNTYKIRWYPDRTQWWVNGYLARTETNVKPGSPMGVRFNLWAAGNWSTASSSTLLAAKLPALNQNFSFDVDYVRVRSLAPLNSAMVGTGTGLHAKYYDNPDFTGKSVTRLDPRINFDWGNHAPDPGLGVDTFSAVWSGHVQAQYTEDYTFTARTGDGVRVYLNNQLVINNWRTQSPTDAVARPIRLTAGTKIPIRVEYYDNTGSASAQLFWSSKSTSKRFVPTSQLYPHSVVAQPVFSPGAGSYFKPLEVVVSCSTPSAVIHYTLDNTAPTGASPVIASGASVTLNANKTLLARAFRPGWVVSSLAAANFVLTDPPVRPTDTTKPLVAITTPASGIWSKTIPALSGTASDETGGSGLKKVTLVIQRLSDNLCWKGTSWSAGEYGLPTTLSGGTWRFNGPFPTGANLPDGAYQIKAVAWDNAGNSASVKNTINTDSRSPLVTITSHATNARITNLTTVSGTVAERGVGSGVEKVNFTIIRLSDNLQWNGWRWVDYNTGIPTTLNGANWTISNGLPSLALMPSGSNFVNGNYQLKAVAYDAVGNSNVVLVPFTKVSSSAAKSTASRQDF